MKRGCEIKLNWFESRNNAVLLIKHLNQGADINIQDYYGKTVLYHATCNNNTKIVELLLKHGADPDIYDDEGNTPLHCAAQTNHLECVKILLKYNAERMFNRDKRRPFYYGGDKCKKLILKHNGVGDPAKCLMSLAPHGYNECTEFLLSKYACNSQVKNAAFIEASMNGYTQCVNVLLKHGADVNVCDKKGKTALMRASKYNLHLKCVKLLLKNNADISMMDVNGKTAFDVARNQECKYLLKKDSLPRWNRYTTAKYYPIEFNKIAFAWLSSSKLPRDLQYLVLPVLAEKWKLK